MSDKSKGRFPGVERETLRQLNYHIEELAIYDRERTKLQAEIDEEVEALKRKYKSVVDSLTEGVASEKRKIAEIYLERVLAVAEHPEDVTTIYLRSGTLEFRHNPESLKRDDEAELLGWAKRHGVLRKISEWKRTLSITKLKILLRERPSLRKGLKGAHFEQGRTLRIKPVRTGIELVEEIEPLRVKL
jgi:phage host-nuclease inhibitor protein Gam